MRKIIVRAIKIMVGIALMAVLYIVCVLLYAYSTDWNPPAIMNAHIQNNAEKDTVNKDVLLIMTWNVGFGSLGKESDFFYDGGKMAIPEEKVAEKNVHGICKTLADYSDSLDFVLLQEVDSQAKRSLYINEITSAHESLPLFSYSFGKNYQVKFIPQPYTQPLGDVVSGIVSYNRWKPIEAKRYSLKAYFNFPTYLFYLDRCFVVEKFWLNNQKQLVVINTHNSAYDPKGDMKKIELEQIKEVLNEEYQKGNYVIMGGDWNQYPPDFKGYKQFPPKYTAPENWVSKGYPSNGWQWAYQTDIPTNRSLLTPFHKDSSYQTVIDYFLVSPNVEVKYVKGIEQGFDFSDHQPVLMKIKLK